jgi:sarcosine oxidase, subunit alpha
MADRSIVLPGAPDRAISIDFEGRRVPAVAGEPVAVALLREGHLVLSRSIKYHRPRGAFCFASSCGSCLMRVGGAPDRLACTAPCSDGLSVATQNALPTASRDLLRTIDWAFPRGMDPHEMFAGVPVAEAVMAKVARQLAGLGELPDRAVPPASNPPERSIDVCVVGLGRAGRAAAVAASASGRTVLGVEADATPELPSNVETWGGAQALAIYRDGGTPLLAVRWQGAIHRVRPRALVVCTGSRDQPLLFDRNDLPGILGGRAVLLLLRRHRLLPSRSALVIGDGPAALPVCHELLEAGAKVTWAGDGPGPDLSGLDRLSGFKPAAARGGSRVSGMTLVSASGDEKRWSGGLVAACGPRAAAFELGVHAGATVAHLSGRGYGIGATDDGATRIPWLWAAGSCTGSSLPSEAQGERAGASAAEPSANR